MNREETMFEGEKPEFEDEWQSVRQYNALPVSYSSQAADGDDTARQTDAPVKKIKRQLSGFQRIIKYQLIICALMIIFITALKFVSTDVFTSFKNWYYEQLNSELIIKDAFKSFSGTADEL